MEKGDSSRGVTLIRDEGESKDSERMRTLGDGVRGGNSRVVMISIQTDERCKRVGETRTVNKMKYI